MFKILLVRRSSGEPLFTFYSENGEVYETDSDIELAETIRKLLNTTPRKSILAIRDIDFEIDVMLNLA